MKIFSTASGRKEELAPADGHTVKMYVCGITPYSPAHVGHAMSYIFFDVVRRHIEYRGFEVQYVQNFTDIDDKIIDRAARLKITPEQLAEGHIREFFEELHALNIQKATAYPRATQELDKIIEVIGGLVESGYAYASGGDVYFRVRKDEDYGKLSHRNVDSLLAGARVELGANKEDPLDFALWKGAKEGEPNWPSPWGPGRPGWHIECSAMALRHLGDCIDIHGGGQDLIFPHHENEIAQSESFTGVSPFVRIWMHNGLVQFGDQKMSKSVSNLITIKEALERWNPDALRLFVLSSYYRNPLKFSEAAVTAAERGLQRLRYAINVVSPMPGVLVTQPVPTAPGPIDVRSYLSRFEEAMDDDFDTPKAIANLFDFASEINRAATEGHLISEAQKALRTMTDILGLTLREPETVGGSDAAPFIELLIATRADLRKAKQFELADGIRDKLTKLGVTLEDRPDGTRWRLAR